MRTKPASAISEDHIVVLHDVPWATYEAILRTIGDRPGIRTTYLDGELEIMSPGRQHEYVKKLLARLIEAYADELDLRLNGFGSETLKRELEQAGLEPDECYILGPEKPIPDLGVEVVVTSGGVDRLEAYARLGVREVWFWEDYEISVHRRARSGTYRPTRRSVVLRGIDIALLERIIREADPSRQTEAVKGFRRSLRRGS